MAAGLSLKNNIFLLLVACVACTPLTAKLWQRWKAAAQGDSAFAGNRLLRGCRMGKRSIRFCCCCWRQWRWPGTATIRSLYFQF